MACCCKGKNGDPSTSKATKKSKSPCRAGVCRCWYCCTYVLPIFWAYAIWMFGLSLYFGIDYTQRDEQDIGIHVLFWGTVAYSFVFIILVQLAYILVLFENTNKNVVFSVIFVFVCTFLLCIGLIIWSIYCPVYCPKGENEATEFHKMRNEEVPEQVSSIITEINLLRLCSIVCALFIMLTCHIYLYNVLKMREEPIVQECLENGVAANEQALIETGAYRYNTYYSDTDCCETTPVTPVTSKPMTGRRKNQYICYFGI